MKMRILMFGWEFPPYNSGGLGVACLGLTRALSDRGAEITFVMPKKLDVKSPWAKMVFADDANSNNRVVVRPIDSILTPYLTASAYSKSRQIDGIYGRDLMSEVLRYAAMGGEIAREEEFDVIYAHDWLSFGAGMEAKRVSGKPLVAHVHATEFDRCGGAQIGYSGINKDVYDIEKAGMEAADVVIAVSQLTKNIIVNNYGIPESKVRVVYNGIDETTAPPTSTGLPRLRALKASGYSLVLFLGRVTLQKGPDYFLRAARRVLERNPKVMFILSGSGDMDRSVMELASNLGIADHVIFTGFMQGAERSEVYAAADLFVMPSVSEPFGITPLEAMRLGTPVLISKQSGVSEIIRHALKADFWDVDEMANQILAVVAHAGLRQTLSNHGLAEAETITWAQAAQKLDGIVHEFAHVA